MNLKLFVIQIDFESGIQSNQPQPIVTLGNLINFTVNCRK